MLVDSYRRCVRVPLAQSLEDPPGLARLIQGREVTCNWVRRVLIKVQQVEGILHQDQDQVSEHVANGAHRGPLG